MARKKSMPCRESNCGRPGRAKENGFEINKGKTVHMVLRKGSKISYDSICLENNG
jgi:hypothetical protein